MVEEIISLFDKQSVKSEEIIKPIADHMRSKLKQYEFLIKLPFAEFAKALDRRISSDVIVDGDLLQSHVPAITKKFETQTGHSGDSERLENTIKSVFIEALEDSSKDGCDVKASQYMRCISNSDHDVDPFLWWCAHENMFPDIAKKAHDILSFQAIRVASESVFSAAENSATENHGCLLDESARANMWLQSWRCIFGWLFEFSGQTLCSPRISTCSHLMPGLAFDFTVIKIQGFCTGFRLDMLNLLA